MERAIQVYWSKGYDGVTIDDLVAGMGRDGRACMPSLGTSGRYSCASLRRMRRRKVLCRWALLSPHIAAPRSRASRYAVESDRERICSGVFFLRASPLVDDAEVWEFCKKAKPPWWCRGAGGRSFRTGSPPEKPVARRDPSHGFCSWPDDACFIGHAA